MRREAKEGSWCVQPLRMKVLKLNGRMAETLQKAISMGTFYTNKITSNPMMLKYHNMFGCPVLLLPMFWVCNFP